MRIRHLADIQWQSTGSVEQRSITNNKVKTYGESLLKALVDLYSIRLTTKKNIKTCSIVHTITCMQWDCWRNIVDLIPNRALNSWPAIHHVDYIRKTTISIISKHKKKIVTTSCRGSLNLCVEDKVDHMKLSNCSVNRVLVAIHTSLRYKSMMNQKEKSALL